MKAIILSLLFVSVSAFADNGTLDGTQFCRTIISEGYFGQPAGEMQHCVSFAEGKMTDNANTFFGNPPETVKYRISDNSDVEILEKGKWTAQYAIEEKTLVNLENTDQVLVLVEEEK